MSRVYTYGSDQVDLPPPRMHSIVGLNCGGVRMSMQGVACVYTYCRPAPPAHALRCVRRCLNAEGIMKGMVALGGVALGERN